MATVICNITNPCVYRGANNICFRETVVLEDEVIQENCCTVFQPPLPEGHKKITTEERQRRLDDAAKATADKIMKGMMNANRID